MHAIQYMGILLLYCDLRQRLLYCIIVPFIYIFIPIMLRLTEERRDLLISYYRLNFFRIISS